MTVEPEMLLAFDREVTFPQCHGMLRRVVGPSFPVPEGETLTWFDPLDGEPAVVSQVVAGQLTSFATVVEWPHPEGLSGAAVGLGDPASVVVWDTGSADDTLRSFSTDRGMDPVHVGRDASGQILALLADLDLLTRAEFA